MSIALGFFYDELSELAANRPKKSEAEEILKRLEGRLEQISDAQSALIDSTGSSWVGKKKPSRVVGLK